MWSWRQGEGLQEARIEPRWWQRESIQVGRIQRRTRVGRAVTVSMKLRGHCRLVAELKKRSTSICNSVQCRSTVLHSHWHSDTCSLRRAPSNIRWYVISLSDSPISASASAWERAGTTADDCRIRLHLHFQRIRLMRSATQCISNCSR